MWSVRNHGTGSGSVGCNLTYSGHQKPVIAIELMENLESVVSCDGSVHVSWCACVSEYVCVCVCV